jgi:hypothetical protein
MVFRKFQPANRFPAAMSILKRQLVCILVILPFSSLPFAQAQHVDEASLPFPALIEVMPQGVCRHRA